MDVNEKSERLIEAASAILNAAPNRRLNAVVLNKTLFYLDLAHLRDHGILLTGNPYIAIQKGPVIAKYKQRLIAQLETRGIARQVNEWDGSKPILLESELPQYHFLNGDAIALAATVTTFFSATTSGQVSDFSHDNPGWRLAWNEFVRLGKPCAIDMLVAMQQIIEDDPWMDGPLLDDDEILAAADAGEGMDW